MDPHDQAKRELVTLIPRLRRFARTLTASASDADDLVQDALERALKGIRQWKPGTRLDSWLFRIAQNAWIDTCRSRAARGRYLDADAADADAPGVDGRSALAAHISLARAQRVLASLPEDQRVAIALVMIEGYSYREAADIVGVPEGTLTSRLFRARTALDAHLGPAGEHL